MVAEHLMDKCLGILVDTLRMNVNRERQEQTQRRDQATESVTKTTAGHPIQGPAVMAYGT